MVSTDLGGALTAWTVVVVVACSVSTLSLFQRYSRNQHLRYWANWSIGTHVASAVIITAMRITLACISEFPCAGCGDNTLNQPMSVGFVFVLLAESVRAVRAPLLHWSPQLAVVFGTYAAGFNGVGAVFLYAVGLWVPFANVCGTAALLGAIAAGMEVTIEAPGVDWTDKAPVVVVPRAAAAGEAV